MSLTNDDLTTLGGLNAYMANPVLLDDVVVNYDGVVDPMGRRRSSLVETSIFMPKPKIFVPSAPIVSVNTPKLIKVTSKIPPVQRKKLVSRITPTLSVSVPFVLPPVSVPFVLPPVSVPLRRRPVNVYVRVRGGVNK
jgi:hypothetical protein